MISTTRMNWEAAVSYCQQHGGQLLEIGSASKQSEISDFARTHAYHAGNIYSTDSC